MLGGETKLFRSGGETSAAETTPDQKKIQLKSPFAIKQSFFVKEAIN